MAAQANSAMELKVNTTAILMKEYGNFMVGIKNIIFNDPATITFWNDGTKTVVKTHADDEYDPLVGLLLCVSKKHLGTNRKIFKALDKFYPDWEKKRKSQPRKNSTLDYNNLTKALNNSKYVQLLRLYEKSEDDEAKKYIAYEIANRELEVLRQLGGDCK